MGTPPVRKPMRAGGPVVAVVHMPSSGHIRPLLPLVAALAERGVRTVQFCSPEWEAECAVAGGEFRAVPEIGIDASDPPPNPVAVAALIARASELLMPWLSEQLLELRPAVVLRDAFALAAHWSAREAGVPEVVFSPMMAFHRGFRPPARRLPEALGTLASGVPHALRLRRIARRLELQSPPIGGWRDVLAGRYGATTLIGTSRALQMRPEGLAGEDVRFVGPLRAAGTRREAPEPALAGLGAGEELVYVSLGTVFENRPAFFRDAAHALARPGRRVILSVGRISPEALGELPEGVSQHAHVDQLAVLERASLFITHGGFNSVQESLAAGVPMVLFPQMAEQATNSEHICALGAGVRLRRGSAAEIAQSAERVLGERSFRGSAQAIGAGLLEAVDLDGAVEAVLEAAGRARTR